MTKIVVYHNSYGCDTGCCGHVIEMDGKDYNFEFAHPYNESDLDFAKRLVAETYGEKHVKDLDWENCDIVDD